jgi:PAS domain S-box-containing protein
MPSRPVRVLLIEDEKADYLLTRRMLASCVHQPFELQWVDSWKDGLNAIRRGAHDVCLLDIRLNGSDGFELLKESQNIGNQAPVILLTGTGDYQLDIEATRLGAADFLVKGHFTAELLERSIRYAIAQASAMQELQKRQEELLASELRFRSVVQSAGDAIVLADDEGHIVFCNKGAETIFGYTEDELLGSSIEMLMPEPYRAEHRAGFERYRVTGRSRLIGRTAEFEALRRDGTIFPIELSLASWTNGKGTMFTAIIRDITERKRAEELRLAKEAAEKASRAKSAFIAHVSHELRTPLHAIIGFTQLLLEDKSRHRDGKDADFLERILLNAKDQLDVINAVLDLSKVEAGRMELQIEVVSVDGLVRDVVKQLETKRRNPDVEIVLRLPSIVNAMPADPQKLKQILMNIVDNALKYTERGSITIELTVHPEDLRPARIDVTDTGIGISAESIHEVFEPFRRIDASMPPGSGGTGLGLSICRSFCDLMGYELQARSEPGRGSTFSIIFADVNSLPLTA